MEESLELSTVGGSPSTTLMDPKSYVSMHIEFDWGEPQGSSPTLKNPTDEVNVESCNPF